MRITSLSVDSIYPAPKAVRMAALGLDFKTQEWEGHKYPGIALGFEPEGIEDYMKIAIGCSRTPEIKLQYFRIANDSQKESSYIHADSPIGEWAAVWYLSQKPSIVTGTAFWTHKELGISSMPDENWIAEKFSGKINPLQFFADKINEDGMDESKWTMHSLIGHEFNRMVLYRSNLFHSRFPNCGWGKTPEDSRLVWTSFFNV